MQKTREIISPPTCQICNRPITRLSSLIEEKDKEVLRFFHASCWFKKDHFVKN